MMFAKIRNLLILMQKRSVFVDSISNKLLLSKAQAHLHRTKVAPNQNEKYKLQLCTPISLESQVLGTTSNFIPRIALQTASES